MRSRTRPSFAVEVKAVARRRQATLIPSRIKPPATPASPLFHDAPSELPPPAKPRRILPNLIVPDVPHSEPEAVSASGDLPPRRRGRPREMAAAAVEAAVVSVTPTPEEPPTPIVPVRASAPTPALFKRGGQPADLAPGEKWKRRLGRWSR